MKDTKHRAKMIEEFYYGDPINEGMERIFPESDILNFPNYNIDIENENVTSDKIVYLCCDGVCDKGCRHIWKQQIRSRYGKKTVGCCPYCMDNSPLTCYHYSLGYLYPEIADEWNYHRNSIDEKLSDLTPYNVKPQSGKKVNWIHRAECGCIHTWKTSIQHRTNDKTGCPKCLTDICCNSIGHNNSGLFGGYDYAANKKSPYKISVRSHTKVAWICPERCPHGCKHKWYRSPHSITRAGHNDCPFCVKDINKKRKYYCKHTNISLTHPNVYNEIDMDKNKKEGIVVIQDKLCPGSCKELWFKCKSGHSWKSRIDNRCYNNRGCPSCYKKTETKIAEILENLELSFVKEFKADWCMRERHMPFDIMIKDHKIIIEIDGPQHFRQVWKWGDYAEQTYSDCFKMFKAVKHDYKIIRLDQEWFYKMSIEDAEEYIVSAINMILDNPDDNSPLYIEKGDGLYKKHESIYKHICETHDDDKVPYEYNYHKFVAEYYES